VIYEVMWRSEKLNIGIFKCQKLQGNVKKLKILKALKIFLLFKFHFMNCNSTKAWTSIVFLWILTFISMLVRMKGMTSHQINKFYILYSSAILISIPTTKITGASSEILTYHNVLSICWKCRLGIGTFFCVNFSQT
jgi:hypothetical protein